MQREQISFWKSIVIVFALVSVLWIVQVLQMTGVVGDLSFRFGNWPHHIEGLKGIIFSPFIHDPKSLEHLLYNTLPIMILLTVLINAYPKVAFIALVFIHIMSGVLVWLLASPYTNHIGISGIIYGLAAFLVASGIFRKDRLSLTIAILVTLVYGSMVSGFIPREGVSWQSHLYGAICGVFIAFVLRHVDEAPPHEFDLEKRDDERHFFDHGHHKDVQETGIE